MSFYSHRNWRKRVIAEYLLQSKDGKFDPQEFLCWMQTQKMPEDISDEACAGAMLRETLRVLPCHS